MKPASGELKHSRQRQHQWYVVRSLILCVVLLIGGFAAGIATQRLRELSSSDAVFADLDAVYGVIEDNYYYLPTDESGRAEMDAEMESGAISGALSTLDDEYTRYLDVDESKTATEGLEGKYGGIGVDIFLDGDVAFVSAVVPESPADRAGVLRGDVIEQINGARVQTSDTNDVVRQLRGEVGESVSVTIVRPLTGEVETLELTFEEIVVPPVTLTFIEGTSYAWLRITLFGDATVPNLDDAIAEIRAQGATGIILDLRGNGGGWVEAARQTLGRFLDPSLGPAMYEDTTPGEGGLIDLPILGPTDVAPIDLPMVVLIDGGTASAAEIVAGALKDYGRATLIGENTYGKGSVQRIFEFSDGSTMRVTVAEWFTPSRARIQSEGVRPDVEVATATEASSSDPVLDTAILLLDRMTAETATPVASPASA
ncbi:MAG: S41 family peptidase [Thermomicrobiales bacterium]|nr:S41 family peptidase [Thermomicrobiales bacterium]MCO5228620.1 S41 family peptidase [Thermomicrobiales bacterium]